MHPGIVGQLRVKRGDKEPALTEQDRLTVELCQHLDTRPGGRHRGARMNTPHRIVLPGHLKIGLEARHLRPIGVPSHRHVDQSEVVAVEQDHPGAGAEHRPVEARCSASSRP